MSETDRATGRAEAARERDAYDWLAGYCEQVARDGIMPDREWFTETAALVRQFKTALTEAEAREQARDERDVEYWRAYAAGAQETAIETMREYSSVKQQLDALQRERDTLQGQIAEWKAAHASSEDALVESEAAQMALQARLTQLEGALRWHPIETAPRNEVVYFWVVPKAPHESYADTSGKPIFSTHVPYLHRGKFNTWGALSKATHWRPRPPIDPPEAALIPLASPEDR